MRMPANTAPAVKPIPIPSKSSERVITAAPYVLTIEGQYVLPSLSPWRVLAGIQKWALPGKDSAHWMSK
jgi:hypothetical protein